MRLGCRESSCQCSSWWPQLSHLCTRENTNLYFIQRVVNCLITADSARQVVSSLQRYADDAEFVDGHKMFTVDSVTVRKALEAHKRFYKERILRQVEDPHAKCVKALQVAAPMRNWKDMMLCWATCEQTYLRNDLMRKLHLCHMKCNHTHAPSCLKDNNYGAGCGFADGFMMSYILDQFVHKTRGKPSGLLEPGATRIFFAARCAIWQPTFLSVCIQMQK